MNGDAPHPFGKYLLRRRLGVGGMGEVFLAEMTGLAGFGKLVALKRLLPHLVEDAEFTSSFIHEARMGGSLNHPNIVQTLELGRVGDHYYLAMEYVEGLTLATLLRHQRLRADPLPLPLVLEVGRQLCDGLAYAHTATDPQGGSLRMIHRDLKPSNILLSQYGVVKIADFGLAQITSGLRRDPSLGGLQGTIGYMSPEQSLCLEIDHRSDLFTLGAVLFELLALAPLYPGEGDLQHLKKVQESTLQDRLKLIETHPPPLVQLITRLLARDYAARPGSAPEVKRELTALAATLPPPSLELGDVVRVVAELEASTFGSLPQQEARTAQLPPGPSPLSSPGDTTTAPETTGRSPSTSPRDVAQRHFIDRHTEEYFRAPSPLETPTRVERARTGSVRLPNNLPAQTTSFIGRETEVAGVLDLLLRRDVRLVTLSGPGGTGKSRLGQQIAWELLERFTDGSVFVALSSIRNPDLVASSIAQNLGVKETPGESLLSSLTNFLRDRELLLLLDNFEQLTAAAPLVGDLLAAAPRLKILVTSRALLSVYGEHEYPVPPLALPDLKRLPPPETLHDYAAVALFAERARGVKADFALTQDNAQAVAEICARLDGLPLAIELAAARSKLFTPQAMRVRLSKAGGGTLNLLTGGARNLPSRQQTLRGAIDWSYDLLEEGERLLFTRVAVFVGGCTVDAVTAVCDPDGELPVAPLDGLISLVDKSMLRTYEGPDGEPSFLMLETLREYALEKLAARGEADLLRQRHAEFCLTLAETAGPQLKGPQQADWLERLERCHDNLRAALSWALEARKPETAARLGGALWKFWQVHGHLTEGRRYLEAILVIGRELPMPLRVTVLVGAGALAGYQGDFEEARKYLDERLALRLEQGDPLGIAHAFNDLGVIAQNQGDHAQAAIYFERGLVLIEALGDKRVMAGLKTNLAYTLLALGDYALATRLCEESLAVFRELGVKGGEPITLLHLGLVKMYQGDDTTATSLFRESLRLFREPGNKWGISVCLESLAGAMASQKPAYAARLHGAAESLRDSIGLPLSPAYRTVRDRSLSAIRAQLDETTYRTSWAQGREMSSDQAIAYALDERAGAPEPE